MGIRPWEVDLLTVEQFDRACAEIDRYLEMARKG